ncbi:hypothetical protein ACWF95_34960 [Streptomyces vinaceus]
MNKIEMFKKTAKRRISRTATATSAAAAILAIGISFSTPAAADSAPATGEGAPPSDGKELGRVITQAEITTLMKGLAPLPDLAMVKGYPVIGSNLKGSPTGDTIRKSISNQETINAFMYKMGDDFPYPMTPEWLNDPSESEKIKWYEACRHYPSRCTFIGKLKPEGQYPAITQSMNTYGQGGTTADISTTTSLSRTETATQGFKLSATIGSGVTGGLDYSITRSVADTELHSVTEGRRYTIPDGKVARIEGRADSGVYIGWLAYFAPYHTMWMVPFEMTVASPTSKSPVSYFLADYTPATAGAAPAAR